MFKKKQQGSKRDADTAKTTSSPAVGKQTLVEQLQSSSSAPAKSKGKQAEAAPEGFAHLLPQQFLADMQPKTAQRFWERVQDADAAGVLITIFGQDGVDFEALHSGDAIRDAVAAALAQPDWWGSEEDVRECIGALVATQRGLESDRPADVHSIAIARANEFESGTDQSKLQALRQQLYSPLSEIATYTVANADEKRMTELIQQVWKRVGDISLSALGGDQEAEGLFGALQKCGFVDRMIYMHMSGLKIDARLCHHSDTSVPLINCLNNMRVGSALKLPPQASGNAEVPIDQKEFNAGLKPLMAAAGKATRAWLE